MRNYFWKCSEVVHLKINFVISNIEVYLVKFFLLNIHEVQGHLIWKSLNVTNLLRIFNSFLRKPLASLSLKHETWRSVKHGNFQKGRHAPTFRNQKFSTRRREYLIFFGQRLWQTPTESLHYTAHDPKTFFESMKI